MKYSIDHIVIAVAYLDRAIDDFYNRTGVRPVTGGRHTSLGTMNALIGLDSGAYLELITIDMDTQVEPPRWMGVDLITEPRITRWALKSYDIHRDASLLHAHDPSLAAVQTGRRLMTSGDTLEWSLTMPLPSPMIEVAPFFLDWTRSVHHPSDKLDAICTLKSIKLYHPTPKRYLTLMDDVGFGDRLFDSQTPSIEVEIDSPRGIITLR